MLIVEKKENQCAKSGENGTAVHIKMMLLLNSGNNVYVVHWESQSKVPEFYTAQETALNDYIWM